MQERTPKTVYCHLGHNRAADSIEADHVVLHHAYDAAMGRVPVPFPNKRSSYLQHPSPQYARAPRNPASAHTAQTTVTPPIMLFQHPAIFLAATCAAASTVPVGREAGAPGTCIVVRSLGPTPFGYNAGDEGIVDAGLIFAENPDGSYTVTGVISPAEANITQSVGQVRPGFTIDWLVEGAVCQ
ncbi:hypothetical protein HYPSUDRAFT_206238 [Hypholoma sublateritium FD-334 SS-4]|uniref:Uncharacterized protein n=1 Tax=Hypholoma sublateritium (strain FD-334 SS-4) TaxID=945553 RepID=A0A0D2PAQ3_HYPSF|nr:hypothetical protein HYPSUDRAFT_206238 [Hypholoma sublateritium FD-334 SS-4]